MQCAMKILGYHNPGTKVAPPWPEGGTGTPWYQGYTIIPRGWHHPGMRDEGRTILT